ncbi:MAG TPA: HAMP domain-containing protein [Herpetosiphonaceae bacterium]|nr:HAMP domain-containing protein [Herpetosiphonaceae bacterium]
MAILFHLRTRLLLASLAILILLAVLVGAVSIQVLALNPRIDQLRQLNALFLQTRDLSLRTQAASADLNGALTGATINLPQAQDFDSQMVALASALSDMQRAGATVLPATVHDQIDALQELRSSYQAQGNALFIAVALRQSDPTPANSGAVAQAIEPTSRLSNEFNRAIKDLTLGVEDARVAGDQALDSQVGTLIAVLIGLAVLIGALVTLVQLRTAQAVAAPVSLLADAARRLGQGEQDVQVPITSKDEVGQLSETFNAMAAGLQRTRAELQRQNESLEEAVAARTAMLADSVARLEEAMAGQSQLQSLLAGVTTPVLPVARGVLLLPLIGVLDDQRARLASENLLATMSVQHARMVILDVTGLSLIDTAVATILLDAARAVRLLGATTIVCGIAPEVAQALTHVDADLATIRPVADLQAAVALAIAHSAAG